MKICFLLFCLLLGVEQCLWAAKIKFKPITKEELEISACDFYPDAKTMILEKVGDLNFDIMTKRLIYRFDTGIRIKFLEDGESEWTRVKIRYYSPETAVYSTADKIVDLKVCTYNLVDGQIVTTKLEKVDTYRNRLNEYYEEISFVFPNVSKGSVAEYVYTHESGNLTNLAPWQFQEDIPVCFNKLTYTIPEYFNFQSRMSGNIFPTKHDEKWVNNLIDGVNHRSKQIRLEVNNLLPVEEEPFVDNLCDLPMRLEFQLNYVEFPRQHRVDFAGSYASLNERLVQTTAFWGAATKGRFPKDISSAVMGKSPVEKAIYLYDWLSRLVKWNGNYGLIQSNSLSSLLAYHDGSVADINLALTALFRKFGLEAYPVILSTRGNGIIHPVYPNTEDFNYVITILNIEGNYFLCDATSKMAFGLLPERCLNGQGWMVREKKGSFVNLIPGGKDVMAVTSVFKFEDYKLKASLLIMEKEYAIHKTMDRYKKEGEKKFKEKLEARYADWELSKFELTPKGLFLRQKFNLKRDMALSDVFYIHPFIYGISPEALFKRETRQAVVDFPLAMQRYYTAVIEIPEGYEAELPEALTYSLPNEGAVLNFKVLNNTNSISLSLSFDLNKLRYTPQEYPDLKVIFEKLSEFSKMVITLKKKV